MMPGERPASAPWPAPHPEGSFARRITLALLTTAYCFGFVDRVVIALVAQALKTDFGISDFEIGLLSGTGFAIVNAVVTLPLAWIAERKARSKVVALSLAIGSFFTALCAATGSFVQLLLVRLGMALGSAGTEAPAHSMISDMYPTSRRASALSLFMLGVPIASVAGSFASGSITQSYGWRATFLVMGTAGLAAAALSLFLMREPERRDEGAMGEARTPTQILAALWPHREFRYMLAATALSSLAAFGVNTFLPAFFTRDYGFDAGNAGLAFGLIAGAASVVGSLIGGYGGERLARRHRGWLVAAPGLGLLAGAPLFVLGITRPEPIQAFPLLLIGACCFYTAMAPSIAVLHGLLDSRTRAAGSALFMTIVYLVGQGLGPPLAGFVSDRLAAWRYGSETFAQSCAGTSGQLPYSACAAASAGGVRDAIICFAIVYAGSGLLYLAAAVRMRHNPEEPS